MDKLLFSKNLIPLSESSVDNMLEKAEIICCTKYWSVFAPVKILRPDCLRCRTRMFVHCMNFQKEHIRESFIMLHFQTKLRTTVNDL